MSAEDVSGKVGLDTTDWKTGVSQLNRDVRTIESGFKAVAAGMDDWRKSADGLTERNNALTQIIDKQKEKVSLLEDEYTQLKEAAEANGDETERTAAALQEFEIKINKAKEQLAKSETEYRKNGEALNSLEDDTGSAGEETEELTKKEKEAEKTTKTLSQTMKDVGGYIGKGFVAAAKAAAAAIAAIGTAIAAAAKKAFDFAKGAGEMADNVLTLSTQTSISADKLQQWQYASNFIDVSVETMTGSMAKMVKQMGSGNKAFDSLGVSVKDSNGNLRDSEDVFADCVDALGGIANESERDALAMQLFGKSAQELNPLIVAGGDALRACGEEAKAMGTVFSEDALAAMGSFDDSMQRFNATGEGLKNAIGLTVIPAFQPLVDTATSAMAQVSLALQDGLQPGEFETLMQDVLTALSTTITGITDVITGALPYVTEGINALIGEVVIILPGLIETLLPAAMSLLQGIVDAITANIEPITQCAISLITSLAQFLIENIPTLVTAATDIISGLVDGLIALLPELIPAAVDMMVQLATSLVEAIPKIAERLPEIVTAIITGLTEVDWLSTGSTIIQGVIDGLLSLGESLLTAAGNIVTTIWDAITNTDWLSLGGDLINGVIDGMGSLVETVKTKVTGFFSGIWDGVKSFFGIHSPSTVTAEDGKMIMEGFKNGAEGAQPSVLDKVKGVFSGIWDGIKSIFGFGGSSNESAEAKKTGKDVTTAVADGISGGGEDAKAAVKTTAQTIVDMFKTELGTTSGSSTKTKPFGEGVVKGIVDGFTAQKSAAENEIKVICNAITAAIVASWGTTSGSSTITKPYGQAAARGIVDGITLMQSQATNTVRTFATTIINAIRDALGARGTSSTLTKPYGRSAVQGVIDGIKGMASALSSAAQSIGKAISDGIAQGIRNGASAITNAARTAAANALSSAKRKLGIASPSKVAAAELGLPFVQGIAQGISQNFGVLTEGMKGMSESLTNEASNIKPIAIPSEAARAGGTSIVSAVLQIGERQFGQLVVELADSGQGFAAANQQRYNLGVQLA